MLHRSLTRRGSFRGWPWRVRPRLHRRGGAARPPAVAPRLDERPWSVARQRERPPSDRARGLQRDTTALEPRATPEGDRGGAGGRGGQKKAREAKKQEDQTRPSGQVVRSPASRGEGPAHANTSRSTTLRRQADIHRGRRVSRGAGRARRGARAGATARSFAPRRRRRRPSRRGTPGWPCARCRRARRRHEGPGRRPATSWWRPTASGHGCPVVRDGPTRATAAGVAPGAPGSKRPLTLADLTPNDEASRARFGRGGSVDAVKDADEGEFTALNTRRWKYASSSTG